MGRGPLSENPKFRTVSVPDDYPSDTSSPVWVLPVLREGRTVGYAWAAVTDDAFGFVRRPDAGLSAIEVSLAWTERRRWARANDVRPSELLFAAVEKPEHPKAGYVPRKTPWQAPGLAAVHELARMDDPRSPQRYPQVTTARVRFVPVSNIDTLTGYLWAAVTDDAAAFLPLPGAGFSGMYAEIFWMERIRWAKEHHLRPLQLLAHWAGHPSEPGFGYVPAVPPQEAPSLDALRQLAADTDPRDLDERYRDPGLQRRRGPADQPPAG